MTKQQQSSKIFWHEDFNRMTVTWSVILANFKQELLKNLQKNYQQINIPFLLQGIKIIPGLVGLEE